MNKGIDFLIHSVAFSPEIKNKAVDTSRAAYLLALSISSYSLTGLARAAIEAIEPVRPDRGDEMQAGGPIGMHRDGVVMGGEPDARLDQAR